MKWLYRLFLNGFVKLKSSKEKLNIYTLITHWFLHFKSIKTNSESYVTVQTLMDLAVYAVYAVFRLYAVRIYRIYI